MNSHTGYGHYTSHEGYIGYKSCAGQRDYNR